MAIAFLTSLTEEEFKDFLKQALKEILRDQTINTQPALPELLDIKQAAEFLKLKVNTLYEKTSEKSIPHIKKGNKLYFNRTALTEWINSGRIKTNQEIGTEATNFLMSRKSRIHK